MRVLAIPGVLANAAVDSFEAPLVGRDVPGAILATILMLETMPRLNWPVLDL